jgi:hypothetical protein
VFENTYLPGRTVSVDPPAAETEAAAAAETRARSAIAAAETAGGTDGRAEHRPQRDNRESDTREWRGIYLIKSVN